MGYRSKRDPDPDGIRVQMGCFSSMDHDINLSSRRYIFILVHEQIFIQLLNKNNYLEQLFSLEYPTGDIVLWHVSDTQWEVMCMRIIPKLYSATKTLNRFSIDIFYLLLPRGYLEQVIHYCFHTCAYLGRAMSFFILINEWFRCDPFRHYFCNMKAKS